MASATMSPLTLFATDNINDSVVVNLARLLQNLDEDGLPGNGVTIPSMAHQQAVGLTVDFASDDFALQVADFIANAGGLG